MGPRVMIVLPTQTYRATPFLRAARGLGLEVVVASDEPSSLIALMEDRYVTLDLGRPAEAAARAAEFSRRHPVVAVLGVDETAVLTAAHVAAALGLAHNPVAAVAATRDKRLLRAALARDGVPQPGYAEVRTDADAAALGRAVAPIGYPCVVKPVDLAASRGVIRADGEVALGAAVRRIGALLRGAGLCGPGPAPLLVERFVSGPEIAVEALIEPPGGRTVTGAERSMPLRGGGVLHVLAVFDKPDPLDGPFFEETLYVTPSRLDAAVLDAALVATAAAVSALGLERGPVHAEVRAGDAPTGPAVIEVAARSIGGLCSQTLSFAGGATLEEVILRQASGLDVGSLRRASGGAGVLMLPTPRAGVLRSVGGVEAARAVPGVDGVTITVPVGERVVPLPEGDRYLGFVFAHGDGPAEVEAALRDAQARLRIDVEEIAA